MIRLVLSFNFKKNVIESTFFFIDKNKAATKKNINCILIRMFAWFRDGYNIIKINMEIFYLLVDFQFYNFAFKPELVPLKAKARN